MLKNVCGKSVEKKEKGLVLPSLERQLSVQDVLENLPVFRYG